MTEEQCKKKKCPQCGGELEEKIEASNPSIHLSIDAWYKCKHCKYDSRKDLKVELN